jgi:twitching motility protein PilJ
MVKRWSRDGEKESAMKREAGMGNLKLWQKQALIVILLSLPMVVLLYLAVRDKNSGIEFAQSQAGGLAYLNTLRTLMGHTTELASAGQRNAGAQIADTLRKLESLDQELGVRLQTTSKLRALTAQWQQIQNKGVSDVGVLAFLANIRGLITQVTKTARLFADPHLDAAYLVETVALELPKQQDFIAQAQLLGTRALNRKELSLAEKVKLLSLTAEIQTSSENATTDLEKAIGDNASDTLKPVAAKLQEANVVAQTWLNLLHQKILSPATLEASTLEDTQAFAAAGNAALTANFGCWDNATQTLAELIKVRSASLVRQRNAFLLSGLLVALLVGLVLLTLACGLVRQLNSLTRLVVEINAGNSRARAEVLSNDELGTLAKVFNEMLDDNQGLVQARLERDEMERSMMKLLSEISGVAQGDLSRTAEVGEGVTGALADAFNHMIAQLRYLIGKVQNIAREVHISANATQHHTRYLAEEAKQRAEQLVNAARTMDAMSFSIRTVTETATTSNSAAQKTLEKAKRGSKILQQTSKSVRQVDDLVQESSQCLKQLGATSREIGEVVQVLEEIAKRSSVLALHASIQAANAGEAGRGFAVVVREVEHLAARSTEAARLISELVNRTRLNTQSAVTAVEESSRGVQESIELVCEAGKLLGEIEQVMTQLDGLIQSVSRTTEQQTKESTAGSSTMLQLSEATRQTAIGISRSAITATQLAALADELNGSVAAFKLAAQQHTSESLLPLAGKLRPISVEKWGSGQYLIQN